MDSCIFEFEAVDIRGETKKVLIKKKSISNAAAIYTVCSRAVSSLFSSPVCSRSEFWSEFEGCLQTFRKSYFQFYLSYGDVWKCERKFRWWIFYFSTKVDLEVNRCWLSLTLKSTKSGPKVTFWTEQGTKISFRAHWRASARAVDIKFEKFRYLGCKTLFEWKHLDQNSLI